MALCSAGVIGSVALIISLMFQQQSAVIPNGVRVAGIDLSNKPVQQAKIVLQEKRKELLYENIRLALPPFSGNKHIWKPSRYDLGADVNMDATLARALNPDSKAGWYKKISTLFSGPEQYNLDVIWKLNTNKTERYLNRRIASAALKPAKDARFMSAGSAFQIASEKPGVALDVPASLALIRSVLPQKAVNPLVLPVRKLVPHISGKDLDGIEGVLARFTTTFARHGNRGSNIQVACEHIDGTVLKPGDIFSYNDIVGPRDAESGFKLAPVIIRGQLEPGWGGGICQVSSTLYNAVLLSNLKIVSRTHHAFPVHYLPAGRDATVAYGSIDFKFQNSSSSPIAIEAHSNGGRVDMRIYGKLTPKRVVKIERTGVSSFGGEPSIIHSSSLPPGFRKKVGESHVGRRVTVWRSVYENGAQVKREIISRDIYRPISGVIIIGSARTAQPRQVIIPASSTQVTSPVDGGDVQ